MSVDEIDELGPVDYLVIEFPAGKSSFNGEMAEALTSLMDRGVIRVLDLLVIHKDEDGSFEAHEIDNAEGQEGLLGLETHVAEILAADDVAHLAEAMENGSTGRRVGVGERLGRAVRFCRSAGRRAARRVGTDPDPGDRGIDRGGRSRHDRGRMTCP